MIGSFATSFLVFLAPIFLALVWKICDHKRAAAKAELEALPFDPTPPAAPAVFLRHLTQPQRVFLTQQLKMGAMYYAIACWLMLFILSLPLFHALPHESKWFNNSAFLWYNFVNFLPHSTQSLFMMMIPAIIFVITPLRVGPEARFYRSRPLTIRFIFWSKILPIFLGIFAGIATGMALAVALLLVAKGPIWHNLPIAIPRTLGPDDAALQQLYRDFLTTSVPSLLLSILTTLSLFFSTMLMVATIPVKRMKAAAVVPLVALVAFLGVGVLPFLSLFSSDGHTFSWFRTLFIYSSLGPPPPRLFALVPVALSIAFIAIARIFVTRLEV